MNAPRALVLLALLTLSTQAATAQVTPAGAAREAGRDRDLEARVEARRDELRMYLRAETQKRIEGAAMSMAERIRSGHEGDLIDLGRKQATARFGKLKPEAADLIAFLILAQTMRDIAGAPQADSALKVDSPLDVGQSAALRQALNRDSALMSALSNILQWTASTKGWAIAEMK
jgi:hypothetical protein